jgi:hypothetical protein
MEESKSSDLEFGRVLESKGSDRKVWFIIIPAVLGLCAVLVLAGLAIAKAGELESKVALAEQQAEESQKAIEERDNLLKKARADEGVLRSPGQGAAVMAAASAESPASGVAVVYPDQSAVKVYAFGLAQPETGREYRVVAIGKDASARTTLGKIVPDSRGTAFLLARNVPEGATGVEVVLAEVQADGAAPEGDAAAAKGEEPAADTGGEAQPGTLVMAGLFPKPGTIGVVAAPDASQRAQARAPRGASRRPLR